VRARSTIRDVAREAGLSVASVSRVFSGNRPVGTDVARRVRAAAAKLDYRPDYLARSLSLRSTTSVGLVVPDIGSPFFPALAQAIEGRLRGAGFSMLLMDAQNDPELEFEAVRELIARKVDGLLISPCHERISRGAVEWAMERVPVVQVDRYATSRAHRVISDATRTIRLAADHLVEQGCGGFAFVGASGTASPARDRKRAYVARMRQYGGAGHTRILEGAFTADWGYEAADLIQTRWATVDAVICANDLIALGVVQGLTDRGRIVPEQVAVTGCDDTFFTTVSRPTITSVAQPVVQMAEHAVGLLVTPTGDSRPRTVRLPPALRVRESSRHNPGHRSA
jgi:LacI family transcriptional regulator